MRAHGTAPEGGTSGQRLINGNIRTLPQGEGADAYTVRARQYAPRTLEETRTAAHRLLAEGYSDHGISAALGLAIEQVRRMLGERGVP